ncbi:hypothetical protein GTW64_33465 [Streptomyces sp. SID4923]|nr:hypothetical protein [Streptomyces sp. SID4923]
MGARYAAQGWHVQRAELAADGDVDVAGLSEALEAATEERSRPSIIVMRSTIAWPVSGAKDTAASHGSALGDEAVRRAKAVLGADTDAAFALPADVYEATTRDGPERGGVPLCLRPSWSGVGSRRLERCVRAC